MTKTVISSEKKIWNIDLREIWNYRSLVMTLFKRNYSLQYKQTILGPLWMIFNIVLNTGIFTVVFGYVGKMSSDGVPYFLFCLSGNVIWNLFSTCFYGNTRVLMDNAYLFGKVYFPRIIVPVSNALLCLVRSLLQFGVLVIVLAVFIARGKVGFTGLQLFCVIPLFFAATIMGTSLGIIISALTVKYRDFDHLTGAVMTVLMYISPVLYPTSQLSPVIKQFVYVNPMSSYIEAFRYCITGTGGVNIPGIVYSTLFTVTVFFVGLIMYGQTEKNFIDIV